MGSLVGFQLRITKATASAGQGSGTMCIIIRRPYAHLGEEIRRTFKGQKDVRVVVDRRYGERRLGQQPVVVERRRADRRKSKEQLVEVVISV